MRRLVQAVLLLAIAGSLALQTRASVRPTVLTDGWEAVRVDGGSTTLPGRDAAWRPVLPDEVLGARGSIDFTGVTWLRRSVRVAEAAVAGNAGIAVGPVDYAGVAVYADGALLGTYGPQGPHEAHVPPSAVCFAVPRPSVGRVEDVQVLIRVWRDPSYEGIPFGLRPRQPSWIQVGDADDLQLRLDAARASRLQDALAILVLGVVFVLAGLYHMQLFLRRRQLSEYFWFGTIAVCAALNMIFTSPWVESMATPLEAFLVARTSFHLSGIAWTRFLWRIFGWNLGRLPRWFIGLQVALILLMPVAPRFFLVTLADWPVFTLLPILAMWFYLIPREAVRGNPEARTICVGLMFLASARLWQMFGVLGLVPSLVFVHWGFLALLISMAMSLSNRFSRVYTELDALNQDLEGKVSQRTRELADTVAQLRESERMAHEAREEAVEASRAKSLFLASMSHELRTPLNAILGYVQLLKRRHRLDAETSRDLGVVMRSGEHLLGLINDTLSISKIEAGRMTLNEHAFDLHALVDGVAESFELRIASKGLSLTVRRSDGVPRLVHGDEGKLRQILINLVSNAVRYTREGGIEISVDWSDRGMATFQVRDSGFGIDAEELKSLFTAFSQTESGIRTREGTGLGLAISRAHARLMGGDITVDSRLGVGSTFVVTIALALADEAVPVANRLRLVGLAAGQPECRVLVVDDIEENRHILAALLTESGFAVRVAASGPEAIATWESWKPAAIWMDIRMAGMDGIEATRIIRAKESGASARTVIIALTASAFDEDRAQILEAGCDDFVSKPYRDSTILAKLQEHLQLAFTHEADDGDGATESGGAVRPDALAGVPDELLAALERSVHEGDAEGAKLVADRIAACDASAGEEVRRLVTSYRFDELADALAEARQASEAAGKP